MAAVAVAVLNRRRELKRRQQRRLSEPITVHLEGIVDEDDAGDSIGVLERLAERDSHMARETMSRFTSHGTWLQTRFIATKTRLFLLVKRSSHDDTFEVVDSIPMHEISKVKVLKDSKEFADEDQQQHQSSKVNSEEALISLRATLVHVEELGSTHSTESKSDRSEIEAADNEDTVHDQGGEAHNDFNLSFLKIQTQSGGFNQGRAFIIDAGSPTSCQEWTLELRRLSKEAKDTFRRRNKIEYCQRFLRSIQDSTPYRVAVFLAIAANFACSMMEAQLGDGSNPCSFQATVGNQTMERGTDFQAVYDGLDLGFTIFFLIELVFNFSAHAVRPFFEDKWNWFDVVVVLTSVAFLFVTSENNGLVKQLRIFRVFRVLRAFGKMKQMREMVNAIIVSIVPAIEALVIGLIVMGIYANIGREFFWAEAPHAFCDFFHAFYTLFGVVAYLTYPPEVKVFDESGYVIVGSAVFIYSFVAFAVLLFLQIVVAVLLENFYKAMQKEREESAKDLKAAPPRPGGRDSNSHSTTLDPILEELAVLDTDARLRARADEIFRSFDVNQTGGLSFAEIFEGLYKAKSVRFQIEDFHRITDGGRLCNADGEIDQAAFRDIMARETRDLVLRRACEAQREEDTPPEVRSLLVISKVLLIELDHATSEAGRLRAEVLAVEEELFAEVAAHRVEIDARGRKLKDMVKRAELRPKSQRPHPSPKVGRCSDSSPLLSSRLSPLEVGAGLKVDSDEGK